MDGILQFLLIIGIIVIGIARQYKKEAKKNADNRPAMPLPGGGSGQNTKPTPQGWEKTYGGYIPEGPEAETKPIAATKKGYQFSSPKQTLNRDSANTSPPPPASSTLQTPPEADSEYSIHSEEEARKAIIWSEILQRKY